MTRINQNSNYWIGNMTGSVDAWWREDEETPKKKGKDTIALAGYRKAISNYVNIVTGRSDIRVKFAGKDSFTDGKTVTLAANLNDKNFDPSVGLALHEGSHIVHSDFKFLKDLKQHIAERFDIDFGGLPYGSKEQMDFHEMVPRIKSLLNYVEDRRIDYKTFKSAPGYKNYYHSMYEKYFNFRAINKGLKSKDYRDPSEYDHYEFRIINFTNKNTDLDALPGLRLIYNTINLKDIKRLESTQDAFNIATDIYEIIMNHMVEKEEDVTSEDAESTIDENGVENASDSASSNEGTTVDTGDTPMKAEESEESATEQNELSISEHATIDKAIKKQKDFTEGKIKKSKLSKKDQNDVEAVEKSGAYHKEVQLKDSDRWGNTYDSKVKVVVVPKLTDALLEDAKQYSHNSIGYSLMSSGRYHDNVEVVQKGLMLGKKLGKKLQIRNEERTTKWTRQESGRIDKRLIAELGFDNGNVFSHSFTTKYNDAYLHISIDASGSMSGEYYENAIKSAAAICQAADMVGNIHVQVTVRTTLNSADSPLLAVVYDSKVNKIVHIKKYWRYLDAKGTTPEGLCFAAIEKQILSDANGRDAFFLNLSDGMPYFGTQEVSYSGKLAINHTKNEVEKLRKSGINILSFFIAGDYPRESTIEDFKKMYGQDASFIDPTNLISLAKVLNNKFLQN
jgi:cobalamin biosynthesis protein CobT